MGSLVRAVERRTFALVVIVPICAAACGGAQRRVETRPPSTQIAGATVEARDLALAAVLLQLKVMPSAEHHRAVAAEYRRLGILDTAFDHLTAATRLDRSDAAAYDARARIWRDWGHPDLGMADAARAVYYAPQSAAAHNTYGTLLAAAGRHAEARHEFETALSLDPGAEFARTNLCRLESVSNAVDRPPACAAPGRSPGRSR